MEVQTQCFAKRHRIFIFRRYKHAFLCYLNFFVTYYKIHSILNRHFSLDGVKFKKVRGQGLGKRFSG